MIVTWERIVTSYKCFLKLSAQSCGPRFDSRYLIASAEIYAHNCNQKYGAPYDSAQNSNMFWRTPTWFLEALWWGRPWNWKGRSRSWSLIWSWIGKFWRWNGIITIRACCISLCVVWGSNSSRWNSIWWRKWRRGTRISKITVFEISERMNLQQSPLNSIFIKDTIPRKDLGEH